MTSHAHSSDQRLHVRVSQMKTWSHRRSGHALCAVQSGQETASCKAACGTRYTVTILALYDDVINMRIVDTTCVLIHIADLRRIRRITADLNVIATASAHSLRKGKLKIPRHSTGGPVKLPIAVCVGINDWPIKPVTSPLALLNFY